MTRKELPYLGRAVDLLCREPRPPFQPARRDYDVGNAWWLLQRLGILSSKLLGARALLVSPPPAPALGADGLVQLLHGVSVHRIVQGDDLEES